jgi:hypothetical protein
VWMQIDFTRQAVIDKLLKLFQQNRETDTGDSRSGDCETSYRHRWCHQAQQ